MVRARFHVAATAHGAAIAAVITAVPCGAFAGTDAVPYVLDAGSEYQQGCFPPCRCPIFFGGLSGSFTLATEVDTGTFRSFSVDDVDWTVEIAGEGFAVTGRGTYTIFAEFVVTHRLELDLVIDDRAPQHFDSGLILGGNQFPEIDITISMNDLVCLDTAFIISASPALLCPGDFDGSGDVGFGDFTALLSAWGACAACPEDLDGNGAVGFTDLSTLLAAWGPC